MFELLFAELEGRKLSIYYGSEISKARERERDTVTHIVRRWWMTCLCSYWTGNSAPLLCLSICDISPPRPTDPPTYTLHSSPT